VSGASAVDAVGAAEHWLAQDPDPETRAELTALLAEAVSGDTAALAELESRFGSRLAFGTAGLRGELGAGSARMNRVLVAQAAAGLAAYLHTTGDESPSVVIGYDGRTNSDVFARDTAEIVAGAGIRAILLPRLLPTPVLAFALRHLGASAGVMVTASHNPPRDNGYKVYLGGADAGSQIVPPADAAIAAEIDRIAATASVRDLPRSTAYELAGEGVVDAYVAATATVAAVAPAPLAVTYTAMHGVGWETFSRVLAAAGYAEPVAVAAQREPDPAFPTVVFPNPEEPGALDLALETARAAGSDLVLANDPDADRLALALPDATAEGGYRALTGNEVGLLLGERAAAAGPAGTLACSLVSSPGLRAIAAAHGHAFAETLTGFKWISRTPDLLFGFEEALGYLVDPHVVRDKDGISAALAILDLASELAARGETLADELDRLGARDGVYASSQVSLRVTDLAVIPALLDRLRAAPPATLAGVPVTSFEELEGGILRLLLADDSRVMVRASGTEPKLKVYLDVVSRRDAPVAERRSDAATRLAGLAEAIRPLLDR
jgi:phosphomannomutase